MNKEKTEMLITDPATGEVRPKTEEDTLPNRICIDGVCFIKRKGAK
jgi:hypothetical protein